MLVEIYYSVFWHSLCLPMNPLMFMQFLYVFCGSFLYLQNFDVVFLMLIVFINKSFIIFPFNSFISMTFILLEFSITFVCVELLLSNLTLHLFNATFEFHSFSCRSFTLFCKCKIKSNINMRKLGSKSHLFQKTMHGFFPTMMQNDLIFHPFQISYVYKLSKS